MKCRIGCGACCIAPSISSPIPGMPNGKPAGIRCIQLDEENKCKLYGKTERPAVCVSFRPTPEICGGTAQEAYKNLAELEEATKQQ
jgi:Fe-S-cluster containining protein